MNSNHGKRNAETRIISEADIYFVRFETEPPTCCRQSKRAGNAPRPSHRSNKVVNSNVLFAGPSQRWQACWWLNRNSNFIQWIRFVFIP